MPFRFCGCLPSGYTHDWERDWWVHYSCGWPTRAWLTEAGHLPPAELLGVKPVTYHEFLVVPRTPKAAFARLTEEQRRINAAWAGRWVRD